jgi:hypothetical protein
VGAWERESDGREEGRERERESASAREGGREGGREGSPHISKRQSKLRVTCFTSTNVQILTQKRGTLGFRGQGTAFYGSATASCVLLALLVQKYRY